MAENGDIRGLTQEQVDLFHVNGYLKIGKLLDDDLIETLRAAYDHEFQTARKQGNFRNLAISDTEDLDKKNAAALQMLQIMQMCERSIHFRRMLYHPLILDMVESLIGPNIQLFHDQALFKPAHCGGEVFWHQDNAYWQCSPPNLMTCWMTLDDADRENGAMQVIPGSHRQARTHERSKSTGALLDLGNEVDASKAVVVELPAGGVMLHHCQTLHYTQPNHTDRLRRAFAIHFMTPGTRRRNDGSYIEVSFAHPMLRMRA